LKVESFFRDTAEFLNELMDVFERVCRPAMDSVILVVDSEDLAVDWVGSVDRHVVDSV
jgi:hypothetical protein